jgi:hypothetical protein
MTRIERRVRLHININAKLGREILLMINNQKSLGSQTVPTPTVKETTGAVKNTTDKTQEGGEKWFT